MNIPARYCTGYLGDIGVPVDPNPMDFSAWFEAFLDGRWYTMDARHKLSPHRAHYDGTGSRRGGRRDVNSFRVANLARFEVVTQSKLRRPSRWRWARVTLRPSRLTARTTAVPAMLTDTPSKGTAPLNGTAFADRPSRRRRDRPTHRLQPRRSDSDAVRSRGWPRRHGAI